MEASHEQIKSIIETALRDGSVFPWWLYLLTIIAALVGSFFGAYVKRKAEDLAIKENFKELLSQVRQTTEATEKIKKDISRISWVDQQRWSLKRELYMELLHSLYAEKEAIFKLSDEQKRSVPTDASLLVLREKFIEENRAQSLEAIKRISKVRAVAGMLLTEEAQKALDELALIWYQSIDGGHEDFYAKRLVAADKAYSIVLQSATEDLDLKRPS